MKAYALILLGLAGCLVNPQEGSGPVADATPVPIKKGPIFGQIIDEAGSPVNAAPVSAFLAGVSPLIGNSGSALIGNSGSALIGNSGGAYRILQATGSASASAVLDVTTDADGRFVLALKVPATYNLEATVGNNKAWAINVTWKGPGNPTNAGRLKLLPTGRITGRVRVASGSADFSGTQVYIPGSRYGGKALADGTFIFSGIPVGAFEVWARHPELGEARLQSPASGSPGPVSVESGMDMIAPDMNLATPSAL